MRGAARGRAAGWGVGVGNRGPVLTWEGPRTLGGGRPCCGRRASRDPQPPENSSFSGLHHLRRLGRFIKEGSFGNTNNVPFCLCTALCVTHTRTLSHSLSRSRSPSLSLSLFSPSLPPCGSLGFVYFLLSFGSVVLFEALSFLFLKNVPIMVFLNLSLCRSVSVAHSHMLYSSLSHSLLLLVSISPTLPHSLCLSFSVALSHMLYCSLFLSLSLPRVSASLLIGSQLAVRGPALCYLSAGKNRRRIDYSSEINAREHSHTP